MHASKSMGNRMCSITKSNANSYRIRKSACRLMDFQSKMEQSKIDNPKHASILSFDNVCLLHLLNIFKCTAD